MGAGRPSLLTDTLRRQIRELVLEGKTQQEIADASGISILTLKDWIYNNYQVFGDQWRMWNRERMLAKAEQNIQEYLHMVPEDKDDKKIKADITKFATKTLGKEFYSERSELTGRDGEEIRTGVVILPAQNED